MGSKKRNKDGGHRRNFFLHWAFRLLAIFAAVALILSYCAVYINPTKFIIPLFFGLYFLPILFFNLLLLIVALVFKSKSAWISLAVIIPAFFFTGRFFKFKNKNADLPREDVITVMSYNVGSFHIGGFPSDSLKDIVIEEIRKIKPDIICLQEISFAFTDTLERLFPFYEFHSHHYKNSSKRINGMTILSKYEILERGNIAFKSSYNLSMYSDIVIVEDTIRVFNNHLESYALSFKSLIKRLKTKDTTTQMATDEIYEVHKKIGKTVLRRTLQVDSLAKLIDSSPYPTMICGDQNETPMSYAYTTLASGHKDSFKEAGKGFGATFTIFYPLIRIDYIFAPPTSTVLSHKTLKWPHSDHYPIIAEISLNEINKEDE